MAELLAGRRQMSFVDTLIKKNTSGFTLNQIDVEVSSGSYYPPIILKVREFVPTTNDFLVSRYISPYVNKSMLKLEEHYNPPIGICKDDFNDLKDKLRENIKQIIKLQRNPVERTSGYLSAISFDVLKAIYRFRSSESMLGNVRWAFNIFF